MTDYEVREIYCTLVPRGDHSGIGFPLARTGRIRLRISDQAAQGEACLICGEETGRVEHIGRVLSTGPAAKDGGRVWVHPDGDCHEMLEQMLTGS